jgi:hypothetical protein
MNPDENVAASTDVGQPADIVVTDQQLFDHATAPEPAKTDVITGPGGESASPDLQQPTAEQIQRARDEQGRFAKQPEGQQQPQQQRPQQQPRPEDHRVPLSELHKERARAQRAEAEAQQMRDAWMYFQQQQMAANQRQQQPEQPQQTIFDNPDSYLNERVISPMQQWGQMEIMKVKDGMSREMANAQFGEQAVNAALQDLGSIRQSPHGDFAFRQIMSSGHPYGALVKWHHQAKMQQEIGPDPRAWLQKQAQAWFNDPVVQQKMVEHIRTQQQQRNNGSGRPPQVQLPPSLSSIPAAAGRESEQGDMSNASLYRFATK